MSSSDVRMNHKVKILKGRRQMKKKTTTVPSIDTTWRRARKLGLTWSVPAATDADVCTFLIKERKTKSINREIVKEIRGCLNTLQLASLFQTSRTFWQKNVETAAAGRYSADAVCRHPFWTKEFQRSIVNHNTKADSFCVFVQILSFLPECDDWKLCRDRRPSGER